MKPSSGANASSIDFVVPGDIQTPTGGYIYDREIVAGLTERGWRVALHALDASFPSPTPAALRAARATFASLADGRVVVIDGAQHAAHHTHPAEFVAAVEAFIDRT